MNEIDPLVAYGARPVRVGFCFEEATAEDITEMAALSFTMWGGCYNPFIDVSNIDEAHRLVRRYECDVLFPFQPSERVSSFIASYAELQWDDFGGSLTVEDDIYGHSPVFYDLISCSRAFIRLGEPPHWLHIPRTHPAFTAAGFLHGFLPAVSARMPLDYADRMAKAYHPAHILEGHEWPQVPVLTVSDLVRRHITNLPPRMNPGVVIGSATDAQALRRFWNMRAAGDQVTFVDPSQLEVYLPWLHRHVEQFTLEGRPSFFTLWSATKEHEAPKEILEAIAPFKERVTHADHARWLELQPTDSPTHVTPHRFTAALPHVSTIDSHPRIQIQPKLPQRIWASHDSSHLMVDLRCSSHSEQPRSITFRLPHFPRANAIFGRSLGLLYRDTLRTRGDAFSLLTPPGDTTLSLRSSFGQDVIARLFQAANIKATPSDAGRYTDRIIRHMGGLQKCRIFKLPGVRKVIDATANGSTTTASNAKQLIRGGSTAGYDIADQQDLILFRGQEGHTNNEIAWTYLLRKRVFLPGAELRCEECGLPFWMSIDDLKSVIQCPHCGESLVSGAILRSNLDWKYKRSPLFTVSSSLGGAIPVALTLLQLHTCFHSEMISWCASLNLDLPDGTTCETDFAAVLEHFNDRSHVVIGECKTASPFDGRDLANLIRAREELTSHGLATYIVFAKIGRFEDEELRLVRDTDEDIQGHIILLGAEELEPYNVFEKRIKRRPILNLSDLAHTSAATYQY